MKRGKWAALLCALAVSAAGAGCGRKALVPQISTKTVLKVDGETYTVPQAKVYLLNYQNLYGTVAGADMWQYGNQDGELEEAVTRLRSRVGSGAPHPLDLEVAEEGKGKYVM